MNASHRPSTRQRTAQRKTERTAAVAELRHLLHACDALVRAAALQSDPLIPGLRRARLIGLAQLPCAEGDRIVRAQRRQRRVPTFSPVLLLLDERVPAALASLQDAAPVLVPVSERSTPENLAAVAALLALRAALLADCGTVEAPTAEARRQHRAGLDVAVRLVDVRLLARDPRGGVRLMLRRALGDAGRPIVRRHRPR